MRPVITWIVVADGVRARLFVNKGVGKGIEPILDQEFVGTNLPTREIGSDQPGRTFDSAGVGGRHAMEPPTDPHRHDKQVFARDMAERLDAARKSGAFDSAGVGGRHAMEPPTDPHRHDKQVFARDMAERLDAARKSGAFDRLVVVAPPDALGDLRAAFSRPLQALVAGELAKDLTKLPVDALPAHLGEVLAV